MPGKHVEHEEDKRPVTAQEALMRLVDSLSGHNALKLQGDYVSQQLLKDIIQSDLKDVSDDDFDADEVISSILQKNPSLYEVFYKTLLEQVLSPEKGLLTVPSAAHDITRRKETVLCNLSKKIPNTLTACMLKEGVPKQLSKILFDDLSKFDSGEYWHELMLNTPRLMAAVFAEIAQTQKSLSAIDKHMKQFLVERYGSFVHEFLK